MSKQSDNFSQRNTLDMNLEKKHKKDLGLSIPDDYFSKSKQNILAQTVQQDKKGKLIYFSKKAYTWSAAAVIALLLTVAVFNPFAEVNELENDILLASIVAEDGDVDALLDDYLSEELLTEEVFFE